MLIRIDEVIGKKTFTFSLSMLISPGNLPNQLISQGVNFKINPITIKITPRVINILLIYFGILGFNYINFIICGTTIYLMELIFFSITGFSSFVLPAKAGIYFLFLWIPAFTGRTFCIDLHFLFYKYYGILL